MTDGADAFLKLLHEVRDQADARLRREYDRSLPFADALFDRWERARMLGFGDGASIYDSSLVYGDVKVGENSWIGPNTLLDGTGGGLTIGAYCSVSTGVHIYNHDTVMWALSGGKQQRRSGPVRIGDRCYIGSQCIIACDVTIGDQCVIAANSFVNRDVPDRTIVGGTPAKKIGEVIVDGDDISLSYISQQS